MNFNDRAARVNALAAQTLTLSNTIARLERILPTTAAQAAANRQTIDGMVALRARLSAQHRALILGA